MQEDGRCGLRWLGTQPHGRRTQPCLEHNSVLAAGHQLPQCRSGHRSVPPGEVLAGGHTPPHHGFEVRVQKMHNTKDDAEHGPLQAVSAAAYRASGCPLRESSGTGRGPWEDSGLRAEPLRMKLEDTAEPGTLRYTVTTAIWEAEARELHI